MSIVPMNATLCTPDCPGSGCPRCHGQRWYVSERAKALEPRSAFAAGCWEVYEAYAATGHALPPEEIARKDAEFEEMFEEWHSSLADS